MATAFLLETGKRQEGKEETNGIQHKVGLIDSTRV